MIQADLLQSLGIQEKKTSQISDLHWSFELLRPSPVQSHNEKNAQKILLAILQDRSMATFFPKTIDDQPKNDYYDRIRLRYAPELSIEDVQNALTTTDYRNLFENFSDLELPNDDQQELQEYNFIKILREEALFKEIDRKIIPILLEELEKILGKKLNTPLRIYYHDAFSRLPRSHHLATVGNKTYHCLGLAEVDNSPLREATKLNDSDENIKAMIERLQLIVHELTHAFVDELLTMKPDERLGVEPNALRVLSEAFTQMSETVLLLRLIKSSSELEDKRYANFLREQLILQRRGLKSMSEEGDDRAKVYPYGYEIARKLRKRPIDSIITLIQSVNKDRLRGIPMNSVPFKEFVADPVSFLSQIQRVS